MTNWLDAEFVGGGQPLKNVLSGPAYGVLYNFTRLPIKRARLTEVNDQPQVDA